METPRIQAAIFDIGMVLLRFDFQIAIKNLQGRCPMEAKDWVPLLWRSGLVEAYDHGKIDTAEFVQKSSELIQFQGEAEQFIAAWSDIFSPNEAMMERVRRWKTRKMPLYLLSNTCEAHIHFFETNYDVFQIFDGRIYSCRERIAKPELEIYKRLLRRHGLDPKAALFVDDRLENVQVARQLGMHGLHYREEELLRAELKMLGLD